MDTGSPPAAEPSFVSLLSGIANDATELLRQEMTLTKLEVKYELSKQRARRSPWALASGLWLRVEYC